MCFKTQIDNTAHWGVKHDQENGSFHPGNTGYFPKEYVLKCLSPLVLGDGSDWVGRKMISKKEPVMRLIMLALALALIGCDRGLQRDVRKRLVEPFLVPEEEPARSEFYRAVSQRCSLPTNLVFLFYDINTAPFVIDGKDFYVTVGVTVKFHARSPDTFTTYLGHEEWYVAQQNWRALLLRRWIMTVDEKMNKVHSETDIVAHRTVFDGSN